MMLVMLQRRPQTLRNDAFSLLRTSEAPEEEEAGNHELANDARTRSLNFVP